MLYTIYMWLVITVCVIVFGGSLALVFPLARIRAVHRFFERSWARSIVRLSGVEFALSGLDKLQPHVPYVFMSNHQSYFDVLCLVGYLPQPARFVAKKELVWLPIFGQMMWATGHIIVDRGKHEKSVQSLKRAAERIRSGTSILVFPEGTRSPDHKLGEFKKGGFMLALEARAPIVPISITGTRPMMPKGGYTFRRSRITLRAGDPILTDQLSYDDRDQLMARVRAAIIQGFAPGTPEREANQDDPVLAPAVNN